MPEMFVMPFRPAYDSSGRTIPGAQAWFTLSGTNTPSPVYTSSGLTTPRTNPIVADGVGKFPRSYLDPAITAGAGYRVRIYTEDAVVGVDTPIEEYDPYTGAEQGSQGVPGPGGGAEVATRVELAAIVGPEEGTTHFLTETGREGMFVFSTANLSTQVTADTRQGIYVAPASDTTGATGAWVRKYSGAANARWFGATGDGVTDDAVALQAWLDWGGDLYLPEAHYYSSAKLIVRRCVRLSGESYGFDARLAGYSSMPGSRIRYAVGVGGFDIQPQVSTTDWASVVPTQEGAFGSVIRDIALIGPNSGAAATGLYNRTTIHLDNVWVIDFQGKGFDISASIGSTVVSEGAGYSEYGGASYSSLRNCHAQYNGTHGFHIRGYDANTILIDNCDASGNAGVGFFDESLIGNTYVKPHCIANSGGDIKAIRAHTNTFISPYIEGGGSIQITGTNVIIGGDVSGINTPGGPSPVIIAPDISHFNKIKFQWDYTLGAISGQGQIYRHATYGLVMHGEGAGADAAIFNKAGNPVMFVPTGTQGLVGNGKVVSQSASGGVGYGVGAGGTVTQATSKSTAVLLEKMSGQITMHNASLAADTTVSFVLNNAGINAGDVIVLNHISGGTIGAYSLNAQSGSGGATINVRNLTAGALGEAIVIAFAVVRAVTS